MVKKRDGYFFAVLAIILGGLTTIQIIPPMAALLVAVFAVFLLLYDYFLKRSNRVGIYVCWLAAIVLGIVVGLYRPTGFNYPLIFSVNQLHDGGAPMSLYFNTAKFLAGYIILYYLLSSSVSASAYLQSRSKQILLSLPSIVLILGIAYELLDLHLYTKPLKYIAMFGLVNLFVTCVAEEAFMRLLLQAQIQKMISVSVRQPLLQELIPLLITTLIFVLTHSVHGFNVIVTYTVAGFSYGLVYCLTKNLWACIGVHFGVNIIHFAFFTYPVASA